MVNTRSQTAEANPQPGSSAEQGVLDSQLTDNLTELAALSPELQRALNAHFERFQAQVQGQLQQQPPSPTQTDLKIPCCEEVEAEMRERRLKVNRWRMARDMDNAVEIPGFLDSLAVFVRESRNEYDGVATASHLMDRREADSAWVGDYYISLHNSLSCWERDGRDKRRPTNLLSGTLTAVQHGKIKTVCGETT